MARCSWWTTAVEIDYHSTLQSSLRSISCALAVPLERQLPHTRVKLIRHHSERLTGCSSRKQSRTVRNFERSFIYKGHDHRVRPLKFGSFRKSVSEKFSFDKFRISKSLLSWKLLGTLQFEDSLLAKRLVTLSCIFFITQASLLFKYFEYFEIFENFRSQVAGLTRKNCEFLKLTSWKRS